jgi:hypothetical protein
MIWMNLRIGMSLRSFRGFRMGKQSRTKRLLKLTGPRPECPIPEYIPDGPSQGYLLPRDMKKAGNRSMLVKAHKNRIPT